MQSLESFQSQRRVHFSVSAVSNTLADRDCIASLKLSTFLDTDPDQIYTFPLLSICLSLQTRHYLKDH